MSAYGGKADVPGMTLKSPLIARSGSWPCRVARRPTYEFLEASLLLGIVFSSQAIGEDLIPPSALLQHSEPFVEAITHLLVSGDLLAKSPFQNSVGGLLCRHQMLKERLPWRLTM